MTCEHCVTFLQEKEHEVQEDAERGDGRAHTVLKLWQRFREHPSYGNLIMMSAVVNAYLSRHP